MRFLSLILVFVFLLSGCAPKRIQKGVYHIVFKSRTMKFEGVGYMYEEKNKTVLQLYGGGSALLEMKVSDRVCVDGRCLGVREFNERYFKGCYMSDFLKRVLSFEPLSGAEIVSLKGGGFKQRLYKKGCYDIIYIVDSEGVYFKDRLNGFLIVIKNLKGEI